MMCHNQLSYLGACTVYLRKCDTWHFDLLLLRLRFWAWVRINSWGFLNKNKGYTLQLTSLPTTCWQSVCQRQDIVYVCGVHSNLRSCIVRNLKRFDSGPSISVHNTRSNSVEWEFSKQSYQTKYIRWFGCRHIDLLKKVVILHEAATMEEIHQTATSKGWKLFRMTV